MGAALLSCASCWGKSCGQVGLEYYPASDWREKRRQKQVLPGFEPGLMEVSYFRIHCDDRYTTEPGY
jgi:hypothetical protein